MIRKNLIISVVLASIFLYNCGGKNQDLEVSPDNTPEQKLNDNESPWWKFWGKNSKEMPEGQAKGNNAKVDNNIDEFLSDVHTRINNLKAELNYYHEDLNAVKEQTMLFTNPFAIYNKEIVLDNGTSIFGKIIYQDQDIMKVETLIGQLIINRNTIVRVVNQVNSYNRFDNESPDPTDNISLSDSTKISGNQLINKRIQSQSAHLVLVGDILETKDASGNTVLMGEVKNVGTKRADFAKINFTFRLNWQGDSKNLVEFINGVTNTFTTGYSSDNSILPHSIGNFELIIPTSFGSFIGYTYEIEWDQDYKYDIEWDQYEK